MLVLTRKAGERIRIALPDGRFIWVTVVAADRERLKIGIEAPADCGIKREEIIPFQELDRK